MDTNKQPETTTGPDTWVRYEVQSSNLGSAQYCAARATLRIGFKSGAHYDYFAVSADDVDQFIGATSQGVWLNKHLKDETRYPCRKVENPVTDAAWPAIVEETTG